MKNENYEILANVANYLNEIAIKHKLISASTASAFLYMAKEEITVEKLETLIFLVLKIKTENAEMSSTSFYKNIETLANSKSSDLDEIIKVMANAITEPLNLETTIQIPKARNFVQIGRSAKPEHGNDIIFKTDKTLSRIHLVVTAEEGQFFIEDRSANGTFVNGVKIEKGVKSLVQVSDEIRIGREGTLVELSNPKIYKLIS